MTGDENGKEGGTRVTEVAEVTGGDNGSEGDIEMTIAVKVAVKVAER